MRSIFALGMVLVFGLGCKAEQQDGSVVNPVSDMEAVNVVDVVPDAEILEGEKKLLAKHLSEHECSGDAPPQLDEIATEVVDVVDEGSAQD